jgi:hypothetical protein
VRNDIHAVRLRRPQGQITEDSFPFTYKLGSEPAHAFAAMYFASPLDVINAVLAHWVERGKQNPSGRACEEKPARGSFAILWNSQENVLPILLDVITLVSQN